MSTGRNRSRGRLLTPEEAARYAKVREQIEAEKPEILERSERRLREIASLGEQFREAREAAGLSLAEMSEKTGIDRATLSKFENGVRGNPTLATMTRYAEALELRVDVQLLPAEAGSTR
jgi:DNA-binding XRE family transcriptional regulator